MKHHYLSRILSSILTLCLLATLFVGLVPSASADNAGDIWIQIEALRDGVNKKSSKKATVATYAAISDDIYALVEDSGTALPGTLQAKGDFICWQDLDGIPCCYSPVHEAQMAGTSGIVISDTEPVQLSKALTATPSTTSSNDIGLIQPYYRDVFNYYDSSFVPYSPAYVTQANLLAAKTGGRVIRYTLEDATLSTIASTLESCGMVIIDSHGGTDYSDGDDSASRANCSYIWLTSGYSSSSEFRQHWSEFLYRDEYNATHTGPYGEYNDVYLSTDGSYCVSGQLIAGRMKKNAPRSLVYLSTCYALTTEGIQKALRSKGVEAVYGYSQAVSFAGDTKYMTSITNSLVSGKTLGEAVAIAKSTLGSWDYYDYYPTIEKARANDCSFPIVVSPQDVYPGQGNVDDLQDVRSTWTLVPSYTVTATANDSRFGTLSVSKTTITAAPIPGYYVQSAEVISGTGTCTVEGNTIEVTALSDCTVLVTFAPKPLVTVTLVGSDLPPVTGTEGSSVTLPVTAAPQAGMELVGWTETSLEQGSAERPAFYAPGSTYTLPHESTTLYALYLYFDETAVIPITPHYVRLAPEDDFAAIVGTGHSFLIVSEVSNSYSYIFNSSLSTPYASKNYKKVYYSDGEKGVLPSDSTTNACAVLLAPVSGGYSMRLNNGSGSYVKSNQTIGIAASSTAAALTVDTSVADSHMIRDAAATGFRFLMHPNPADSSYSFGFTNSSSYKTVLYRYEDETVGQWCYITAGEGCLHTATVLIDAAAPTCTSAGNTGKTVCASCGLVLSEGTQLPALGHDTVDHEGKEPTCTASGWNAYQTCKRCDYTTYEVLPAPGHDTVDHEGKEPTCTASGWAAYQTCKRCDYTTYEVLPALGHDIVDHEGKAPTCTASGWAAYQTCKRCSYTTYRKLSALGHDLVNHEAKAPTCTEIGWTAYQTCTRCDYTTYEELMALYHDIVKYEAKAPTCTEPGWAAYKACTRCSYSTYKEIPATGHTLVTHAGRTPTCTEIGWNAYQTCSCCGYTTYQQLAPLGHEIAEHESKAPTCTEVGWTAYQTCSRCSYTTYRELAPLGHAFINGCCSRCDEMIEIESAALHLSEDINLAYAVNLPEGAEAPYMVFTSNGQEHKVDTFTLDEDGQYRFEFMGINPQCMGDNISATLHATVDGTEYTDTIGEYSVREYCVNLLEKTDDEEMKTLLSDILSYGAAAQIYTDYQTDELITDGLDLAPSSFAPISGKTVSFIGEQDPNTRWTSAALVLSNDFAARFTFATDNTDGLSVEVSINGRTQRFDMFEETGDGRYFVTFEGIKVTELDDTVAASFLRDGETFGAEVHYSVNTYICGTQNSANEALASLVQALYNYGASATAYANECVPW